MTMAPEITPRQLKTLQALFGLYARRILVLANADERMVRLAWASKTIGREVASFSELRGKEAARLIDVLKVALGQAIKSPVRKRLNREDAMARGAHGRRGHKAKVEMMATPDALEEVARLREHLGWTEQQFEGWLRSRSSPLCGRGEPKLLTIGDCNRVRWALHAMLRRAESGPAEEESAAKKVS